MHVHQSAAKHSTMKKKSRFAGTYGLDGVVCLVAVSVAHHTPFSAKQGRACTRGDQSRNININIPVVVNVDTAPTFPTFLKIGAKTYALRTSLQSAPRSQQATLRCRRNNLSSPRRCCTDHDHNRERHPERAPVPRNHRYT